MDKQTDPDTRLRDWEEDGTVTLLHPGTPVTNYGDGEDEGEDEDPFASAGDGQAPVAHSDPTLVADFDPSQPRDEEGQWAKEGEAVETGGTINTLTDWLRGDLSAETISVLINSGELDVNAICRDSIGRFASCGAAGLPPSERSGVSEARMVHARLLVEQVRSTKTPDAATVKELANHLGTLTVAQLHSLKKEYGLKASGNKAVLKEKLTARFSQKGITPAQKATESTPTPSSSPPGPVHVPEGTFGTTKNIKWGHPDDEAYAHEVAQKVLGSNARAHDLASIAGAPDGSLVRVTVHKNPDYTEIIITARGSKETIDPSTGEKISKPFNADRALKVEKNGTKTIHNDLFEGKGTGLQMFGRQVENATKWGFTHIETYAAGQGSGTPGQRPPEDRMNGYYTWPRFGYNGKVHPDDIESMPPDAQRNTRAAGGMLSGLMSTKEGRDWWMGHGESKDLKFDLTPGSYSQDTLNTYLKHRGILK